MKGKRLVLRIVLLTLLTILTVALIAVGVFAVLGWNMHQEAVTSRPVRQVYAELSQEEQELLIKILNKYNKQLSKIIGGLK